MSDEKINKIAGELDCGLKCFVHKENGALISYPDELNYLDFNPDEWTGAIKRVEDDGGNELIDYYDTLDLTSIRKKARKEHIDKVNELKGLKKIRK
jgi:hypothetical protein